MPPNLDWALGCSELKMAFLYSPVVHIAQGGASAVRGNAKK